MRVIRNRNRSCADSTPRTRRQQRPRRDDKGGGGMFVYRLELTLWEKVFFASREIDELFQTEPVLGNYALTYALGLAVSPYRLSEREDRPSYREDLSALNEKSIYVTP